MGGVRVNGRSDYLVDFLRERGFHEMRKARHEYLSYYGFDQEYVFVLVEGVVKASVTLREGTRFNISYIKGPSPVSLLRDEVSSRAKSPYSVRVESPEAIYMAVPRVRFWEFVNEDSRLLGYVKDYYRASLEESLYRMRYLTMNGKVGAVRALRRALRRGERDRPRCHKRGHRAVLRDLVAHEREPHPARFQGAGRHFDERARWPHRHPRRVHAGALCDGLTQVGCTWVRRVPASRHARGRIHFCWLPPARPIRSPGR